MLLERIARHRAERAENAECARAMVDTARAIIDTLDHRKASGSADADALDLAYCIVNPRGRIAPFVARALAGTLPAKEYGR